MKLSFKDTKFIIESLDILLQTYNQRLQTIESLEEFADEAADLGNDCLFIEALKADLEKSLSSLVNSKTIESNYSTEELINIVLQLSLNDKLLLIESLAHSLRNFKV